MSTVSLNRDEMAGAENTGWMLLWRIVSTVSLNRDDIAAAEENCEHRLVKPGRRYERGERDLGESAPTVNGTISTDCKRDDQHRLQTGRNMSGGDFGGRLDRVGFWAGFSFVFSFLCRFSFLSCCFVCWLAFAFGANSACYG